MSKRLVTRSLRDYVVEKLQYPDAGTITTGFNIYDESQLRSSTHIPTRPFIYVVNSHMNPTPEKTPMLVIEIDTVLKMPFELGNRDGKIYSATLNLFAPDRAFRDDIGTYLQDTIGLGFNIRNYSSSGSPVIDRAEVITEPSLSDVSLGQEAELADGLDELCLIGFEFMTRR